MDEAEKKGNGKADGAETAPEEEAGEQTSPLSEVEQLRQQLEAKELEAKENYDRYLRQAAELDNFKKRTAREKTESIRYANETLMREILPTLDNLERAVEHATGGGNGESFVEGIEMVLKGLLEALNRHGLSQIAALGEAFNPEKHEAFAQVERTDCEPNTVVQEHHKGYYLCDRLLRPALVTISKLPESKEKKSSEGEVENGEGDD
ncbi:MAG: nucleotide exchange factor GrpE [Deltaproteobacteria bacterium]|nr:nucleotide exchange factor GrpE [Deltaproteobacteria bacterium]